MHLTLKTRYFLGLIVALFLCGCLYWSGLQGGVLFDDYSNLSELNSVKTAEDWNKFVWQGIAGELGRPISLLSFALQVDAWQANNVWVFKLVNLGIHLLIGCLLFILSLQLTKYLKVTENQALLFALLSSSLWLIHPLNVSTTLYVVQRMTQLSTLFTVFGIMTYLYGRQWITVKPYQALFFMSLGLVGGGLLAVLSKENGVLILFYLLALEVSILTVAPKPRIWWIWASLFLFLPTLLFLGYLGTKIDDFLTIYTIRDFNLTERLLTQSHVLVDYLSKIFLINTNPFGLFQDDFPISRALFTPITTLLSVVFLGGLFVGALYWRKRFTVVASGILWFFSGHLLESSIIPLVIYFEHRNYLAMVGMLWIVAYGFVWGIQRIEKPIIRHVLIGVMGLWVVMMGLKTALEVDIWSNPIKQAVVWAQERPQSFYAQSQAASVLASFGQFAQAQKYHEQMIAQSPEDSAPYLLWLAFRCFSEQVQTPDMSVLLEKTKTGRVSNGSLEGVNAIVGLQKQQQCALVSRETVHTILENLIQNPKSSIHRKDIYAIYSDLLFFEKNLPLAIEIANKSLALAYDAQLHYNVIRWLFEMRDFQAVLEQIQSMRQRLTLTNRHLFSSELDNLEALTREALLAQQPANANNFSGKENDNNKP
ncbi:hypothetical protein BegalDRAFT_1580 [Beggiatoa alba B18LD]|uniref:Tetratricopeptide repeat protein n=1 Tax=Beggiatoa alba B18LD TaxID=395493 RepID=I3CFR7_9GAMM|nr:hypothetical protein [Beggiatoa alba]EIJ42460.1 hypothetical protein BegalDRAFT_1580 [Beggiatoa alba B18LD]